MQIKGSIKGDVSIKRVKYYPSENSRIAVVVLSARFTPESANAALGEVGEKALFAAWFKDPNDDEKALFKSITPDVVFEDHIIELMDWKGHVTPELGTVKPVKGENKVDVDIELPLPAVESMRAFYGKLCTTVGAVEKVKFKLASPSLPNMGSDGPKVVNKPGPHGSKVSKTVGG